MGALSERERLSDQSPHALTAEVLPHGETNKRHEQEDGASLKGDELAREPGHLCSQFGVEIGQVFLRQR